MTSNHPYKTRPAALPQGQGGVSLIEVLITLALVSFGTLSITRMQLGLQAANSTATQRTTAQSAAQEALTPIGRATPLPAAGAQEQGQDTVATPAASLSRAWKATATAAGDVLTSATVAWTDSRGKEHQATLSTVVSRDTLPNQAALIAQAGSLPPPGGVVTDDTRPWGPSPTPVDNSNPTDPTQPPPGDTFPPTTPVTPTSVVISGAVSLGSGASEKRLSITAGVNTACSITASNYRCSVPYGWSGTLSITSNGGQKVSPAQQAFSNLKAASTGATVSVTK